MMNAVNGDKDAQRIDREISNNLYSSPEQLATGLEARWYGERTDSGSSVQRKKRYARYVTRWIAV